MLTLRGGAHIRTSRQLRRFRSCRFSTGLPMFHVEAERKGREAARLIHRELRRRWLQRHWSERFRREAARLRVLPPSARCR